MNVIDVEKAKKEIELKMAEMAKLQEALTLVSKHLGSESSETSHPVRKRTRPIPKSTSNPEINKAEVVRGALATIELEEFGLDDVYSAIPEDMKDHVTRTNTSSNLSKILRQGKIFQIKPKNGIIPAVYTKKNPETLQF